MSIKREIFEAKHMMPSERGALDRVFSFLDNNPDNAYTIEELCHHTNSKYQATRNALRTLKITDRIEAKKIYKAYYYAAKVKVS